MNTIFPWHLTELCSINQPKLGEISLDINPVSNHKVTLEACGHQQHMHGEIIAKECGSTSLFSWAHNKMPP